MMAKKDTPQEPEAADAAAAAAAAAEQAREAAADAAEAATATAQDAATVVISETEAQAAEAGAQTAAAAQTAADAAEAAADAAEAAADAVVGAPALQTAPVAPVPAVPPAPSPYYPPALPPAGPEVKGNRVFGTVMAVLATLVFGLLYFVVISAFVLGVENIFSQSALSQFLGTWVFWLPVAAFFLIFWLLVMLFNRAGWWAYVLGGFLVAVAVYFASYLGRLLFTEGFSIVWASVPGPFDVNPDMSTSSADSILLVATTVIAAVIAREVVVWFGAAIGGRGQRIKRRNAEAKAEFQAKQQTPQPAPQAAPLPPAPQP